MDKNKLNDFLYEKESYEIRGACFEIWKKFRGIFKEKVVEKALEKELKDRGFRIESQKRIDIYYKGEKIGNYTPDLIINGIILIELKAKPYLTKEDEKQFWHYLRGSHYKLGFLINFGSKELEIRRRIYDKAREKYKEISADQRTHQRISASTSKSFTLVELLLAISIFVFLIMAALGIYISSITKHRQALRSQVVSEDLSYATEIMYRDIKKSNIMALSADGATIYLDHPTKKITGNDCAGGTKDCFGCSFSDTVACDCCLKYRFNSTDERIEVKGKGDSGFVPLTSPRTIIEKVDFFIPTVPGKLEDQPRVTILIKAVAKGDEEMPRTSEIFLQMTVTQDKVGNVYAGKI